MRMNEQKPSSLEEAKDIAAFFQAFGYANALRAILDKVTGGELDLGPKASGFIAMQLAHAQKRVIDSAELGEAFIDYWDDGNTDDETKEKLHTLEDILRAPEEE